ncbi:hypothetical protein ASPBRDRAFT_202813 [Aspergillus brasiliensis CBS 101740]|uniref:Peptidase C14 caspase domain-containing protein n=1 Tax=Aspergillus brasiliensis (strain CBS 101740 / IMI 381727 / IBT 21946) TaxID=767769 RepID=A0A1L9V2A1_ASPBC|nr:hypothetical protein ASPBRDRAFT_202813 [Aspergillus brasiliensis CBS 101740]
MGSLNYNQFQATLRAAVERRTREYSSIYSLTVRWEDDDTNAESDTNHFQNMLKNLDIDPAEEFVISSEELAPEFCLSSIWHSINGKARRDKERSLIIFHYAGHGTYKRGRFSFADTRAGLKTIDAEGVLIEEVKNPARFPDSINTDVLFIFDCCYAHYATRAPDDTSSVIEVLAATSVSTVSARSPPNSTFTAKLANEIACRKARNHESVEFASAFQTLRKESTGQVRPTHALLVGASSIILPLNGYRRVDPRSIPAGYKVLFAVNVSRDLTKVEIEELVSWIRRLPPFAGLSIEDIFQTGSMCLIMRAALSVYAKLHNMQGYTLIAENPASPLVSNISKRPGSPVAEGRQFIKEEAASKTTAAAATEEDQDEATRRRLDREL